jgi:hypothetical protein
MEITGTAENRAACKIVDAVSNGSFACKMPIDGFVCWLQVTDLPLDQEQKIAALNEGWSQPLVVMAHFPISSSSRDRQSSYPPRDLAGRFHHQLRVEERFEQKWIEGWKGLKLLLM